MSEEQSANQEEHQEPTERRRRIKRRRRRTHQPMADGGNEGSPSSGLPWLAGLLLLWVVLSVTTVLLMKSCLPQVEEEKAEEPQVEAMSRGEIERVRAARAQALKER
jgi:hypothetical protein